MKERKKGYLKEKKVKTFQCMRVVGKVAGWTQRWRRYDQMIFFK